MNVAVAQEKTIVTETKATKTEALSACTEVLQDDLAAGVLVDKYLLCDGNGDYVETRPDHLWRRLAKAISVPEKDPSEYEEKFYDLLKDFKFVPAGRVLYGLGNPFVNVTLKNCYVIAIPEDSIKGIFQTAYFAAETYKSGGGVGIDLSILRPKGSPIRNAARYSTGAHSFMDFFSSIAGLIGQKARIGALLLSLDVSHPDIEEFISIKGGDDLDLVRFANISVKISDKFMKAVESDSDFDLVWGGKIYRTIKARDLWNKIIHKAWRRGEPGLLFWDKVCREVPAHNYPGFKTITTNPCVTGDMRLFTSYGYKTIRELWHAGGCQEYDGKPSISKHGLLKVVNRCGVVEATNVYRTSTTAEVYRITLKNGAHIDATKNHKFVVKGCDTKLALEQLSIGNELVMNCQSTFGVYDYPEYAELAGWVVGDGSLVRTKDEQVRASVRCWGSDIDNVLPQLRSLALAVYSKSNKSSNQKPEFAGFDHTPEGFDTAVKEFTSNTLGRLMAEDGLVPGQKHRVPKRVWEGNKRTVAAFLRGFFSADGSVQINENKKCISVRLAQVRPEILSECQLLLNQFGITSTVHFERRKKSKKLMNNGKGGMKLYNKKAEHELIISGRNNVEMFIKEIGFNQDWKNKIANLWLAAHLGSNNSEVKFTSEIVDIRYIGVEETFCLTEPVNNLIVVNGFDVGNCGEACLSNGDSCDLGSVNLGRYVTNPFTTKAAFDHKAFAADIRLSVRFLDNIISLEKTPLEFQQAANDNGRRLGLGIMGLADVFLKMGISYDSEEAIKLTEEIMQNYMISSYDASCDLAKEKGSFPIFNTETHFKSEFIQRLPSWLKDKIKENGIRNISLHAIAPTGSIAVIAGCSSGIEPVFMMNYIRKTNLGTAKKVQEHEVIHTAAKEFMAQTGVKLDDLPPYFVTAHSVKPEMRIRLQSTVQRFVDQSISNCLTGDSLILTNKGIIRLSEFKYGPVGEFINIDSEVNSINVDNNKAVISQFYNNGTQPVKKLRLDDGNIISGTDRHQLRIIDENLLVKWVKLSEIKIGDFIVGRNSLGLWGNQYQISTIVGEKFEYDLDYGNTKDVTIPIRMSTCLARFLGYYCSDGSCNKNGVALSQEHNEVCYDWAQIIKNEFGLDCNWVRDERAECELFSICAHSRVLVAWMDYLGIKHVCSEKHIPSVILRSGPRIIAEFIKGLTLDGYILSDGRGVVPLCSRSEQLVHETQQLLYNFGIRSCIDHSTYDQCQSPYRDEPIKFQERDFYNLRVPSSHANRFLRLIGFAEIRKQTLGESLYHYAYDRDGLIGNVPGRKSIIQQVKDNLNKIKSSVLYEFIYNHLRSIDLEGYDRKTLIMFKDLNLIELPDIILDRTYRFDKVTDIIDGGIQHTYDISVPDGNSYVANGLVSHNTVNLAEDVKEEKIGYYYLEAWKNGLKGITVYRDGSREGVLVSRDQQTQNTIQVHQAPKRPDSIRGRVHIIKPNGKKYTVFVGFLGDRVYEVFALDHSLAGLSEGMEGTIKKTKEDDASADNFYYFESGCLIVKHLNRYEDQEASLITRLISTSLRHGTPLEFLVDQINKSRVNISSLARAIARALSNYIKEEETIGKFKCPDCGSRNVRFQGMCAVCLDCGISKCG